MTLNHGYANLSDCNLPSYKKLPFLHHSKIQKLACPPVMKTVFTCSFQKNIILLTNSLIGKVRKKYKKAPLSKPAEPI